MKRKSNIMGKQTSIYKKRCNIYIAVQRESDVQELQDGTLIFYIDVRHLSSSLGRDEVRIYLQQFRNDIEGKE